MTYVGFHRVLLVLLKHPSSCSGRARIGHVVGAPTHVGELATAILRSWQEPSPATLQINLYREDRREGCVGFDQFASATSGILLLFFFFFLMVWMAKGSSSPTAVCSGSSSSFNIVRCSSLQ
jgi:hypothetical protein